jgi:hypothetical protein
LTPRPVALAVALSLIAPGARADDAAQCPAPEGASPALAAIDARTRLRFITHLMRDQADRARTWRLSWSLVGTALAAGSYGQAAFVDTREERIDPIISGTAAAFIPIVFLLNPLRVIGDEDQLAAELDALAYAGRPNEPCLTLSHAEILLAKSADNEAFGVGPVGQVIAVAANTTVALVLGLGFQHWKAALINGVGGMLLSEAQIFTQPTGAVAGLASYRAGTFAQPTAPALSLRATPVIAPGMVGGAVRFTF